MDKLFIFTLLLFFTFHFGKSQNESINMCGVVYYEVPRFEIQVPELSLRYVIYYLKDSIHFKNHKTEQELFISNKDSLSVKTKLFFDMIPFSNNIGTHLTIASNIIINKSFQNEYYVAYPINFTVETPFFKEFLYLLEERIPKPPKLELKEVKIDKTKRPEIILENIRLNNYNIEFDIRNNTNLTFKGTGANGVHFEIHYIGNQSFIGDKIFDSSEIFRVSNTELTQLQLDEIITIRHKIKPSKITVFDNSMRIVVRNIDCNDTILKQDPFGGCSSKEYYSDEFILEIEQVIE